MFIAHLFINGKTTCSGIGDSIQQAVDNLEVDFDYVTFVSKSFSTIIKITDLNTHYRYEYVLIEEILRRELCGKYSQFLH